jgi:AraC-like DNA-binding protein
MEIVRVSSTTNDEAASACEPYFQGIEIGPSLGLPFRFAMDVHRSGGLSMMEYSLAGREIRAAGQGGGFMVTQVGIRGEMLRGRDTIDVAQPFVYPTRATAVFQNLHCRILDLDVDAVQRFARADLGNDEFTVRQLGLGPVSADLGRKWMVVSRFAAERMQDGTADLPLIGTALTDLLTATFLNTFRTTWSDARQRHEGPGTTSSAVRRARIYIEENHARPISSPDIAQAARLSVRGLREAFRRELGLTPSEHLRRVRLAEARRSLLNADGGDAQTVAAIAAASGFSHPSRFAAAYRAEFGELPSRTRG